MIKTMAINAGSSSLKWKLYNMPEKVVVASGIIERIGEKDSIFSIRYNLGKQLKRIVSIADHEEAVQMLLKQLIELSVLTGYDEISGVGHRVAAGGEYFNDSVVVTEEVLQKIELLSELAPLHNPANATGIKAFRKILPDITSVAVFDTSFHQTMDKVHFLYSIPYEYYLKHNARKYGYHGTSHKYVSYRAAEILDRPIEDLKIISCHLGNGASICAIQGGESVDTSMGFTPLAGLTMGTRSGDVDVSLLPFIMEKENIKTVSEMIEILNSQSGLKGISGISNDIRDLKAVQATNERASLALNIFKDRIKKYIGSYAATLNGVDAIVFTAGIGENDITLRKEIIEELSFLEVEIDGERNDCRGEEKIISSETSKVKVLLVPTDEEAMIVQDVERLKTISVKRLNAV